MSFWVVVSEEKRSHFFEVVICIAKILINSGFKTRVADVRDCSEGTGEAFKLLMLGNDKTLVEESLLKDSPSQI